MIMARSESEDSSESDAPEQTEDETKEDNA